MCDTLVALGSATADGAVLFAKNSDRDPNEAQMLTLAPHAEHPAGDMVPCTYRPVPQVRETYAVLLSRPFWLWGTEMGANECGVVIGNEAVFTKAPFERGPALTGMDLLRLALERAATAPAALEVITGLLADYGQGGSGSQTHAFYYHNSFLIADPREAWVLETAGREWAAARVRSVGSISNAITIGAEWDLASEGLVPYAVQRGWCRGRADFDFARCYSDFLYTRFSAARSRQCRSVSLLNAQAGRLTVESLMAALRDHGEAGEGWSPAPALWGADVCMHWGAGPVRISQTAGSMVSHLTPERQTHWLTGTAAPCTGLFKPVWLEAGLPDQGPAPTAQYDAATLWWRHEALHRAVLRDYAARLSLYRAERDAVEKEFIQGAAGAKTSAGGAAFSAQCFAQAEAATRRWTGQVQAAPLTRGAPFWYVQAWRNVNRQASFT